MTRVWVVVAWVVIGGVGVAQPVGERCDPPAYAHIRDPELVGQMVEAGEAAHVARPEDQAEWRQKAGLTPGMAKACAAIAKEKGKAHGRPEHAGGGR